MNAMNFYCGERGENKSESQMQILGQVCREFLWLTYFSIKSIQGSVYICESMMVFFLLFFLPACIHGWDEVVYPPPECHNGWHAKQLFTHIKEAIVCGLIRVLGTQILWGIRASCTRLHQVVGMHNIITSQVSHKRLAWRHLLPSLHNKVQWLFINHCISNANVAVCWCTWVLVAYIIYT